MPHVEALMFITSFTYLKLFGGKSHPKINCKANPAFLVHPVFSPKQVFSCVQRMSNWVSIFYEEKWSIEIDLKFLQKSQVKNVNGKGGAWSMPNIGEQNGAVWWKLELICKLCTQLLLPEEYSVPRYFWLVNPRRQHADDCRMHDGASLLAPRQH